MAKVSTMIPGTHLSVRAFCEEFERDRETIAKRVRELELVPSGKKGGYPVYRLRDLAKTLGTGEGFDPDKLRPFERHAHYKAELDKIKLETERRELVPRLEHEAELARAFKHVARTFDVLPDVVERDAGAGPLAVARIERVLDEARTELHRQLCGDDDETAENANGTLP